MAHRIVRHFVLSASLLVASAGPVVAQYRVPGAPRNDAPLTILQINDVYSTVPIEGRGGLARVATIKKQIADAGGHPFLVLAGDFLSSSVSSSVFRGEQMVATLNEAGLDIIARSFQKTAPYEPFLGGAPIEEVAVYFSSASKMNFADNGALLRELQTSGSTDYPHFHAVRGACKVLQGAHIPFGVITRKQIRELGRYRVIVLPNVLRMDAEECAAIRREHQSAPEGAGQD